LDGCILACGGCDWRYDVRTGSVIGIPALRLTIFDAKADDGKICIADA
jgi:nitrite reductase/ring-hydroxylating ferredoxin subunit